MLGRILPFRAYAALAGAPAGGLQAMNDGQRQESSRPSPARIAPIAAAAAAPGAGDTERFRRLVLPHLDGAYDFARFLCRDPAAAEDIVQEAFLQAWRGFGSFRGGSPRAWLFAIVRNCFFNWTRRGPPGGESPFAADQLEAIADEQDDPESALMRSDEAQTLRALVEALPEPFREALVLRELEELSYREIAEVTAAPIGTVMSRLARARQLLCAAIDSRETGR